MKNKMDERIELKPCPFCGDKLILQLVGHFTHAANYKVNCPIEGHHVKTDSDVVAWNRRTPEVGSGQNNNQQLKAEIAKCVEQLEMYFRGEHETGNAEDILNMFRQLSAI